MNTLILKKSKFIERFKSGHWLRLHMSLLLLATVGSGLLATRLMLALGLKNVVVRYPLAVVFAYLTFFIFVKLWLKYVASPPAGRGTSTNVIDLFSGPSGGSSQTAAGFRGGGGQFGGGGVSGSFAEVNPALAESSAGVAASGLDTGGGATEAAGSAIGKAASALDLDEGWLVAVVLLAIAAVLLGAGIYLVYQAPLILSEAAFEGILAAGLARGARRISRGDWLGSVFRATWVPLAVTFFLALLAGWLIHHFFPGVTRLSELFANF